MNPTRSGCTSFTTFEEVQAFCRKLRESPVIGAEAPGDHSSREANPNMVDPRLPSAYRPSRHCLNADNPKMNIICEIIAPEGQELCYPCIDYANQMIERARVTEQAQKRPRVRAFTESARSCQLTTGCAGTMSAALKWVGVSSKNFPELYWFCSTCQTEALWGTGFTRAATGKVLDFTTPRVRTANVNRKKFTGMNNDELIKAYEAETAEATVHMRDIVGDAPKPELERINQIACDGSGPRLTCGCPKCVAFFADQNGHSEELE